MNKEFTLQKTNDLKAVEIVLIENIYLVLKRRDELIKRIVNHADDYKKVLEAAEELRHIDRYNGTMDNMKNQLFEYASVETLRKIVYEEKFASVYNFQDPFTISKLVLKEFGYGSEIKQSHPKAEIAKKLGAKIVI